MAVIKCDPDFLIQDYDQNARILLKCGNELYGQRITIIMSPFIAKLHDKYFEMLRVASDAARKTYAERIARAMTKASSFVIYNQERESILCNVTVDLNVGDLSSIVTIRPCRNHNNTSIPESFLSKSRIGDRYVESYESVTCVMMDLSNSTVFCNRNNPMRVAEMYYEIYKIVKASVVEYYPYIYIHELLGDSIFLIVNAPFMIKSKVMPCSGLALEVSFEIQTRVDGLLRREYNDTDMHLRVGIARGDLVAGIFDATNFRVFGSVVNMSQRLEAKCKRNEVNVSTLSDEIDTQMFQLSRHESYIKGFGTSHYVSVKRNEQVATGFNNVLKKMRICFKK